MSEQASFPEGPPVAALAVVARTDARTGAPASYLSLAPNGDAVWTSDPAGATSFQSLREAARVALRLPAAIRAYGLPRRLELQPAH